MCNRCAYKRMERRAKKRGLTVHVEDNEHRGGVDLYLVPVGRELNRAQHWNAWFLNPIPKRRVCKPKQGHPRPIDIRHNKEDD